MPPLLLLLLLPWLLQLLLLLLLSLLQLLPLLPQCRWLPLHGWWGKQYKQRESGQWRQGYRRG